MRYLLIPGFPLFMLTAPDYFGEHFPLWLGITLVLLIVAAALIATLRWMHSGGPSCTRINHTPPTYLYGMDMGKGTSKGDLQEYVRHPDGTVEHLGSWDAVSPLQASRSVTRAVRIQSDL